MGAYQGGKHTGIRGNVVDDGPLVRVGPGVPVKGDAITSVDADKALGSGGGLVAGNVGGAEGGGLNESEILVERVPTSGGRTLSGRRVEPDGVGTSSPDAAVAVDSHSTDKAVSRDQLGDVGRKAEQSSEGLHVEILALGMILRGQVREV